LIAASNVVFENSITAREAGTRGASGTPAERPGGMFRQSDIS
jgi:hypothetical protein